MNDWTPAHIMEIYRRTQQESDAPKLDSPEGIAASKRNAERAKLRVRYERVA